MRTKFVTRTLALVFLILIMSALSPTMALAREYGGAIRSIMTTGDAETGTMTFSIFEGDPAAAQPTGKSYSFRANGATTYLLHYSGETKWASATRDAVVAAVSGNAADGRAPYVRVERWEWRTQGTTRFRLAEMVSVEMSTGVMATAGAPKVIGISGDNLVSYDVNTRTSKTLIRGIGASGVLTRKPGSSWVAIERPRRWDGLDTTEIALFNSKTLKHWKLSKQMHRKEIHVQPIRWLKNALLFEMSPAFSGQTGAYQINLTTGKVTKVRGKLPSDSWRQFSEAWGYSAWIPDPEEFESSPGYHFYWPWQLDASRDKKWAVTWMQIDWPMPGVDWFPVYIFDQQGAYLELPLQRPAVFAQTLGR